MNQNDTEVLTNENQSMKDAKQKDGTANSAGSDSMGTGLLWFCMIGHVSAQLYLVPVSLSLGNIVAGLLSAAIFLSISVFCYISYKEGKSYKYGKGVFKRVIMTVVHSFGIIICISGYINLFIYLFRFFTIL